MDIELSNELKELWMAVEALSVLAGQNEPTPTVRMCKERMTDEEFAEFASDDSMKHAITKFIDEAHERLV